jgi:exopolysaccharide biosynthesis polyprenyl glycosylphosphotransferase
MKSYLEQSDLSAKKTYSINKILGPYQSRIYYAALLVFDSLMVYLSLWLAFVFRFRINLPFFQVEVVPDFDLYALLIVFCIPLFIGVFFVAGLYNAQNLLGGTTEYALVFRATSISLFLLIVIGFFDPDFIIARGWLLTSWIFSFLFVTFSRFTLRRMIYALRTYGYYTSPTLIVGANDEGKTLAKQLLDWPTSGMNLVGFIDKKHPAGTLVTNNLRVLGAVEELDQIIEQYGIQELILATSSISSRDKMLEIFECFGNNKNVNLRLSSGLYEIITTGLTVKEFAYVPLVYVNKVRLTGPDRIGKSLLDISIALTALLLLSPVLIATAILIKLDSPGPILYRRRVMGVSGKQFDAFKFRTMYTDGTQILETKPDLKDQLEQQYKLKDDPRVTPLGKILRKYSLDELPQLFNVLFLQMSVVGPRIISPEEMREYSRWGINLLTVRPGMTGLWQVSGRSDVSYEERVRLDMNYIRNWTIWLDLQLLFRTIPVVIHGRGAY